MSKSKGEELLEWLDEKVDNYDEPAYQQLKEMIQKSTMTVARTRYWADLLTACRGDYRGLIEEIVKELGGEVVD